MCSSVYSCHLFLISSASVRSIPCLSFIVLLFAWNILIFLKRSLVFPILLFPSISLHWLLRKAFLSLLAILWNSAFRWMYLSFSPLPFNCLLFSAISKSSSDKHFAFLHFFFLEMVLITAYCTILWTFIHSSSSSLSGLIPWIYLSLPLYNRKGFDLGHTWKWSSGFPYFLQLKSDLAIRSSWSEPQSAPGLVFADCIELLHFWLKKNIISLISVLTIGDVHV